jgi:hypothetical protein
VSASTLQLDEDPLLAAVSLLEANWISVREIFELVKRVLARIFVGLWPKKKANVPDLKNLAKAFDTDDDPILTMKGLSLKRGAEGAIAFAYAHVEEVNWEKVSSSLGRLIHLKRIYNFLCSMLVFAPFPLCFVTLCGVFMRFPELTY